MYKPINKQLMMKPIQRLIERAKQNGSIDRLNQLLSASHLLLCEANGLLEEAADLMAENGLMLGELKQLHNRFTTAADRYFREFAGMVTTERQKMDMFGDMDGFDNYFRRWAKLPREWRPKKDEEKENGLGNDEERSKP